MAFSTIAAAITLVMVFVLHHTQRREQVATQLKLDELIRALPQADDHYVRVQASADDEMQELEERHIEHHQRHSRLSVCDQGVSRTATTAASSSLGRSASISSHEVLAECLAARVDRARTWLSEALQAQRDRLRAPFEDAVGERDQRLVGAERQRVALVLLTQSERRIGDAPPPARTTRGRTTTGGKCPASAYSNHPECGSSVP